MAERKARECAAEARERAAEQGTPGPVSAAEQGRQARERAAEQGTPGWAERAPHCHTATAPHKVHSDIRRPRGRKMRL